MSEAAIKSRPKRKPHNHISGYVCERKHNGPDAGHIVVYDRKNGADWIDGEERWVVMHEPSSCHVTVPTKKVAIAIMKNPEGEGILPSEND